MSGLMQKYNDSLANTPGPVSLMDLPKVTIDYRALAKYIRENGITKAGLTEEEKSRFVVNKAAEVLHKQGSI